jgi:hypothetical protein
LCGGQERILALPWLTQLASDKKIPLDERLRYFRAFDFLQGNAKSSYLLKMLGTNSADDIETNTLVLHALDIKNGGKFSISQEGIA